MTSDGPLPVAAATESLAAEKNLVLKTEISDSLPAGRGDERRITQALLNLVGNAIKYSRPRDPAEIEIRCAGTENGFVVILVRDNGVGFDMKYMHKLFGAFQRRFNDANSLYPILRRNRVWPFTS